MENYLRTNCEPGVYRNDTEGPATILCKQGVYIQAAMNPSSKRIADNVLQVYPPGLDESYLGGTRCRAFTISLLDEIYLCPGWIKLATTIYTGIRFRNFVRSRLKFKDVYVRFTRASVRERRHIGSRIPSTLRYVSQSRKKKEKKKKRKRWSCVLARSTRNSVAGFNTLREISGTRVVSKKKIIEWRRIHNIFLAYLEAK